MRLLGILIEGLVTGWHVPFGPLTIQLMLSVPWYTDGLTSVEVLKRNPGVCHTGI